MLVYPPEVELNSETMKGCLQDLSGKYSEQYTSSGFPPKICTLILKELITTNKLKCKILDLGCGKGYVGEYLKADGFLHITGLDCSRSLINSAKQTKCYENLEKGVFGQGELDEGHHGKYDVVISASMINNDGWDKEAF
jgi:2-polyprenyl-3-methyl-5-hydroxy-6-metoxy-1,4-benzoquinol methylase